MGETGQLGRIITALEHHLHKERVDLDSLAAEGHRWWEEQAAAETVWERPGLGSFFTDMGTQRGAAALEDAVFASGGQPAGSPFVRNVACPNGPIVVVIPAGWSAPSLNQYYRALDTSGRRQNRDRGASLPAVMRSDQPQLAVGVL